MTASTTQADALHVAFGCDVGYLIGAAAAVQSLLSRHEDRVHLHLLASPEVGDEVRDYFDGRCRTYGATLHWHVVDRELPGKKQSHLFRLLIAELIDPEIDRILYLDSDLVVLDDLSPIFELDTGDAVCAAALDYLFPTMGLADNGNPKRSAAGFVGDEPYVNTGVLLVRPQKWRERNVTERALAVFDEHKDYLNMVDQDALNLLLKGDLHVLDARWNLQLYSLRRPPAHLTSGRRLLDDLVAAAENPAIAHFTGKAKPWNGQDLRNPFRPAFHEALLAADFLDDAEARQQRKLRTKHRLLKPINLIKPWRQSPTAAA
ncbi:MAG: glycosyltransferase family 8 protein [Planctomycetota bacterium]